GEPRVARATARTDLGRTARSPGPGRMDRQAPGTLARCRRRQRSARRASCASHRPAGERRARTRRDLRRRRRPDPRRSRARLGRAGRTAHVHLSAMPPAGVASGLAVAGFATQAQFLVNYGVLDALGARGDPQPPAYLRGANAVQKLTSPAEMGELIKVLALT